MKKIIRYLLFVLPALLLFAACKKEAMKYNSTDSVYFTADSTVYTFVDKKNSVTKDTVLVAIKLIGKLADKDRLVSVSVDSGDAVEGKDYSLIKPVILAKGANECKVKLVLNRTAELVTKGKILRLSIAGSDDIAVADYPSHDKHRVMFSDKAEKPDWWDNYFYNWPYSDTRMRFYINVVGSVKSPTKNGAGYDFGVVIYMLKAALIDYNQTHSTPLSDEYGLISWNGSSVD